MTNREKREVASGLDPFPSVISRAQSILVAPARNDRDLPFGFSGVTKARVAPGWQAAANKQAALGNTTYVTADLQADFALLTLAIPVGRAGAARDHDAARPAWLSGDTRSEARARASGPSSLTGGCVTSQ